MDIWKLSTPPHDNKKLFIKKLSPQEREFLRQFFRAFPAQQAGGGRAAGGKRRGGGLGSRRASGRKYIYFGRRRRPNAQK